MESPTARTTACMSFSLCLALLLAGCLGQLDEGTGAEGGEDLGATASNLTAAQRRDRAAIIRDAAAARGITEGWLLAGIADAETRMSQCWSELTWACQGPSSPDCGGGPVVAGAGDGPCGIRQGGLGMFQFDAGTYTETLAREGNRILTVAGNTDAAVDFVLRMMMRSEFVDGIGSEAEAIAWINSVRPGTPRMEQWAQTVTRHYNGCRPTSSCWASRLPRYRNHALDVRAEMGASFWETAVDYAAEYEHQSFPLASQPFELAPGEEFAGYLDMRNTGAAPWEPGFTFLGTSNPRDGESALAGPDWVGPSRAATVEASVAPGDVGRFAFTVRAPAEPGEYPQFFNLVEEGVAWFSDQGGPVDDIIQIRVTVLDVPPVPGTGGETDGGTEPSTPPGREPDAGAGGPGEEPEPMTGGRLSAEGHVSGGCSTAPGRGTAFPLAIGALLILARRRCLS